MKPDHIWQFYRTGGFDQVRLDRGADLLHLDELDQKLWVALACPTRGVEFDLKTLDLIDTDKDGRIRAPEIISAVKWACSMLKNPDDLTNPGRGLKLASINDEVAEGRLLIDSAREILAGLGKKDADEITVEDTLDTTKIFSQTRFNGDGIIPADAADDDRVKAVIEEIIASLGAETDLSGKPGVNLAKTDQFFADAAAFDTWWKQGEDRKEVFPLGEATLSASATLTIVKPKLDDYFARCRLAAFDERALGALNLQETEYLTMAAKDLVITDAEVAGFPLARIEARKPLPLGETVNPAWAAPLAKFHADVVVPLLGRKDQLTEGEWEMIKAKFVHFDEWTASRPGVSMEKLGIERLREILTGDIQEAIHKLIDQDKALEANFNAISKVDKLVRFHRDLDRLLNNFVSFRDFYARRDKAIFQVGRLYLDQRSCDLCIRVEDMSKHGVMAGLSRCCLVYCECTRKHTGEKMTIAAAFTDGDSDNLMAGRNGVFYDRTGQDWDATVVKIVENPISIRQAFWSPYKKFLRMIEEQVAKRAAAAEASRDTRMQATAQSTVAAEKPKTPEPPKKMDIGTVAALGVAVGGITAAFGVLMQVFFGLGIWMPVGIVGLMLTISTPSMIIAWLKLRQRNLGPLLDANGWAVNTKAKINIPFGKSLTALATLPPNSRRNLLDPYAENRKGRNRLIALTIFLILLAGIWYFGPLQKYLPDWFPKSSWVEKREADLARVAAEKVAKTKVDAGKAAPVPPGSAPPPAPMQ